MTEDTPRPSKGSSRVSRLLWNVPVGVQLSVIYAVLVAATLAVLGWALYTQLDNFLVQNTADRVRRVTDPHQLRPLPRGITLDEIAGELVHDMGESGVQINLLDAQGQVVSTSQSTSDSSATPLPTPPAGWADSVKNGSSLHWISTSSTGERELVMLSPIILRGERGSGDMNLYMEVVASLGAGDDVLNQLRLYILLGIVLGTAIGVVAGLALTRLVLRPLDRMVRTSEAIAAGRVIEGIIGRAECGARNDPQITPMTQIRGQKTPGPLLGC